MCSGPCPTCSKPRSPHEQLVWYRAAQRLEPAQHAGVGGRVAGAGHRLAVDAGAFAPRHSPQFFAIGQRRRSDCGCPQQPGAADAVFGVPHRQRAAKHVHGQCASLVAAPFGVLGRALESGRFAPGFSGVGHHPRLLSALCLWRQAAAGYAARGGVCGQPGWFVRSGDRCRGGAQNGLWPGPKHHAGPWDA